MYTSNDPYGDMDLEEVLDVEDHIHLSADNGRSLDFTREWDRNEVHTFEEDFGAQLDESLADELAPTVDEDAEEQRDYEAWVASREPV